jgi:beta-mannosidase
MKRLLNGTWQLSGSPLKQPVLGTVPGSVYGDLLRHKLIPDPFDQDNEYAVREWMNHEYRYRRTFEFSLSELGDETELVFEGLDTIATVLVNERVLAHTDNMHRTYRFSVMDYLVEGTNTIEVVLHSCLEYIREKDRQLPYPLFSVKDAVKGYIHIRKGSSMFGWDWGPQLPDAGIWRDIYLETHHGAKIVDIAISQTHDSASVTLGIAVQNVIYAKANLMLEAIVYTPKGTVHSTKSAPLQSSNHFGLTIEQPELWQPVGHGAQPLYTVSLTIKNQEEILVQTTQRIGLQTIHLKREKDQWGESFTFVVNGLEIFAKGADYIPEDNLLGRTNKAITKRLLEAAVAANHNMVRVWGGGIYPADYFFDLCDELGLLVWQDLMFACSVYDMNDKALVATMTEEIIDNLRRFRHHACLALICGNNENEVAIAHWGVPSKELSKQFYVEQYEVLFPKLVSEYAPEHTYWPSSPSSGGGFHDPNSDHFGDMHYWGVWHNNEPIQYYRNYFPRFMSEFGIQSFPSLKTVKTFAREKDLNIFSYIMEQHQKNNTANDKILNYVGKMFQYPKNFNSLLYVSQLIQAEGVRYGVEHWRRNRGQCMGALYWQLNDCWPVASWSGIDYYHRWKALHYHSKKFYQPVLLSIAETDTTVKVALTNDSLFDFDGVVTYTLMDFSGKTIDTGSIPVSVAKQSVLDVFDKTYAMSLKEKMTTVFRATFYANGEEQSANQVSFVRDKHLDLRKPRIRTEIIAADDHYEIHLITDQFAKYVELSYEADVVFSDNYFHLFPGIQKIVTFPLEIDLATALKGLTMRSLFDTY